MKAIIDKKMYDTEDAELIGEYQPYIDPHDFNWLLEQLYKTKKGNYFLYAEGGPKSCYSKRIGNNTIDGDCFIKALTREEALEWCDYRAQPDNVEKEFADMIETA